MEVVSERTQKEINKARALEEVESALRQLTSNLLRVVRGAGKPDYLNRDARAFVAAMDAHWEAAGCYASSYELQRTLDVVIDDELGDKIGFEENVKQYAMRGMIRASLQIVASRLVDQRTQESKGESDFFDAYNVLQEHRAQMRIQREKEVRAATPVRRKAPIKRKATGKPKVPKT